MSNWLRCTPIAHDKWRAFPVDRCLRGSNLCTSGGFRHWPGAYQKRLGVRNVCLQTVLCLDGSLSLGVLKVSSGADDAPSKQGTLSAFPPRLIQARVQTGHDNRLLLYSNTCMLYCTECLYIGFQSTPEHHWTAWYKHTHAKQKISTVVVTVAFSFENNTLALERLPLERLPSSRVS